MFTKAERKKIKKMLEKVEVSKWEKKPVKEIRRGNLIIRKAEA